MVGTMIIVGMAGAILFGCLSTRIKRYETELMWATLAMLIVFIAAFPMALLE